ncbi:dnaJ (Hsp40) homolog, subfamily C, member 30b [Echeneis naucrates]|nr:dnaJ homolog subfamily B member 1-like [Echeneis naucrates]
MAEVGQKLASGACRLSALRSGHSRPGCSCRESRVGQEAGRGQHGDQPLSESVYRRRKSKHQQVNGTLLYAPTLEPDSFCLVGLVETRGNFPACETALHFAASLLPAVKDRLLLYRMTCWTRGAISNHPDTFRSPQQLRALCTVMFMSADQGSEGPLCGQRLRRLKLQPDPSTAAKNYCWRSGSSSKEAPLLYRSRTAYYDILKISPGATQSQIKTAYYKQSFIYHPDKNPGSKEASQRFSEISEAYTILGNISLRRKYDRGILSQSDIQSAGRPSSKDTTSRSPGSPQKHHQQRPRQYSKVGGRPMFDFDAFYRAHYGEQLQREREMKARKEQMQQRQREHLKRWWHGKMMEMTVGMLMAMAGLMLLSVHKP